MLTWGNAMALRRKLTADDYAVLEIVEDPIWMGEFLRSTSDGSIRKYDWPKQPFRYTWYQRDILTDQNEYIVLCAGRAIGKCSPYYAKVYTYEYGYQTIGQLRKKQSFSVYALDATGMFVQRRARIEENGTKLIYRVATANGLTFDGTDNHPLLTPAGYKQLADLDVEEDRVAVVTRLPHDSQQRMLSWPELRWLGYVLGNGAISPQSPMRVVYQKQLAELRAIATHFDAGLRKEADGTYRLTRKPGPLKSYMAYLLQECGITYEGRNAVRRIPDLIRRECLDNIRVLLESLFGAYGTVTPISVSLTHPSKSFCVDIQELLLRFGVETDLTGNGENNGFKDESYTISTHDYTAYYSFFQSLKLPGVNVSNLAEPERDVFRREGYRFERITSIEPLRKIMTYAVYVYEDHNYISDGLIVHNSLIFEDKIIHESVNDDLYFPQTKEQLLATANKAQLDPVMSRLIARFLNSRFLKDFLKGNINRSQGTFDFPIPGSSLPYRITARIAGMRGETNMVGLHVPRMKFDEAQLFPMPAWIQIQPALNTWERPIQQLICGVPNGQREGNVLYLADQILDKFKRYHIPAPINPRWSYSEHMTAIRQYGGEDSQDFMNLVLGKHGEPSFTLIPYESIVRDPYEFYSYRFSQDDKSNGKLYSEKLQLPKVKKEHMYRSVMSIDTGYTDPTLIQLIGQDDAGVWRTLVRWRLTRIPFPEQAEIIAWIDRQYDVDRIAIDLGAGGNGIGIMQDLMSERFPASRKYAKRIHGVRFNDMIVAGQDPSGNDLKTQVKSYAAQTLSKMVAEKELHFSELDLEGISQMVRISAQKLASGENRYFILSETGAGTAADDHIFASYICFVACLAFMELRKERKKLYTASWG